MEKKLYLSHDVKMEIVKTLMAYDDVAVWYDYDNRKWEVTPHSMLTNSKENKVFYGRFYQKDFFQDDKERNHLSDLYEQAMRPLAMKTYDKF